jgi:1,4-alpha-glucan branching enzyme
MDLHERIGAWLTSNGCFFRVWAPHASSVTVVVQDGPYWEIDDAVLKHSLVRQGEYWSATVPGVRAWQLYRFEIRHPAAGIRQRLDPAARDVLSSELTR